MYSSCQLSIGWKISKWKYKKIKKLYKTSTSAISIVAGPNLCNPIRLSLACLQNYSDSSFDKSPYEFILSSWSFTTLNFPTISS